MRRWILRFFCGLISDDNFSNSHQIRLVNIAARLRRYSPSPHPLLRLLSHIPALLLVTNHILVTIRLCRAKVVNSKRLCLEGLNRLLRQPG